MVTEIRPLARGKISTVHWLHWTANTADITLPHQLHRTDTIRKQYSVFKFSQEPPKVRGISVTTWSNLSNQHLPTGGYRKSAWLPNSPVVTEILRGTISTVHCSRQTANMVDITFRRQPHRIDTIRKNIKHTIFRKSLPKFAVFR